MFRWEETKHHKPFIGLIGAGQMADVCAVPAAAGETLEVFWMTLQMHLNRASTVLPSSCPRLTSEAEGIYISFPAGPGPKGSLSQDPFPADLPA